MLSQPSIDCDVDRHVMPIASATFAQLLSCLSLQPAKVNSGNRKATVV